ncbi:sulfatase-like hydrolase/transferase [Pseudomonas gessardii]|uniref:sulfatase-like hydrolase/transferase n=1 Tax=Pseudomonas gessardii TaxID=78544 RepID=UPI0039EB4F8B
MTGCRYATCNARSLTEYLQPEQKGKPGYEGMLNRNVVTVAELLKGAGYNTFMSGKWHLGATEQSNAAARGFERSFTGSSHLRV